MTKKRIWSSLLSLIVAASVLLVFGGTVLADDEPTVINDGSCGDNITYKLYDNGLMEITGTGAMYDDTDWGANQPWISYRNMITSVHISQGVTHIGEFAFRQCSNLVDISIPSSVTSIGRDAFYYCKGMEELTISGSVSSIGVCAFSGWSNLKTVNLPASGSLKFNNIPSSCFSGCENLESINIPEGITSIGSGAFNACKSLKTLTLPSTINELNYGSFCNTGLTTLTIPDGVTSIPEYCFNNCTDLETVILPDSINTIGPESFGYCESLKSIVIPAGVTTLPYAAFVNCTSLESVTLPDTLVTIGDDVFYNNVKLKSVDFPDSLTTIGMNAFANPIGVSNAGLTTLVLPDSVTTFTHEDGFECKTFANTNVTSLSLPGSMETIPYTAFSNNKNLQSITFGEGTKVIEGGAFRDCPNITTVVIPKTVEVIGYQAFGDGSSMTDIYCYADPENLDISMYNGHGNYNDNTKFHVPAQYLDQYKGKFPELINNLVGDAEGSINIGSSTHLCGHSITLDGTIGVNFYMTLGDNVLNNSDAAYMLFTLNGKTQKVKVSDAARDGSYYIFRCNTVAKEMTDTITAQMYISDGNPDGDAYTYTVRDYAAYILNHKASYSEATVNLVNKMMNYGAAAQIYFNYNVSDLANSIVSDTNKPSTVEGSYEFINVVDRITYSDFDKYQDEIISDAGDVHLAQTSISLKSTLTLRLYFENVPEGTVFKYKNKVLQTTKSGKYIVVTIDGFNYYDINTWAEVDVSYGETHGIIAYSPLKYMKRVMLTEYNSTITWQLKQVVSSLVEFTFAISEYVLPE